MCRLSVLLSLLSLAACAGEDTLGRRLIRPGGEPDLGAPRADALAGDAALLDWGPPVDLGPDAGPPTRRPMVWYLLRHDPPADGLRAALEPSQHPDGDAVAATAPAPLLVTWAGPSTPGADRLLALLEAGRAVAPRYDMAGRAEAAAADGSWLAARALEHPAALRIRGRPVLVVRPTADRAGLTALRVRLGALPVAPFVVMEVGAEDRPWPAADAILPRIASGLPFEPEGAVANVQDAARRRAGRAAALAAGWAWLPRAGPAPNERLVDPAAPVWLAPEQANLKRAAALARREIVPALPVVVVDGLGGFADDRQLDAIVGETTEAPAALTAGLPHVAYGSARLAVVRAYLEEVSPGPRPDMLGGSPVLLEVDGPGAPTVTRGEGWWAVDLRGARRAEWLLEGRPFRLGSGASLDYASDSDAVRVDLEFDGGERLSDVLGPLDGDGARLDGFAGRVVQAVLLEATGAGVVEGLELRAPAEDP